MIQAALCDWAYGLTYQDSAERRQALLSWKHHSNWHRPCHGIGRVAPNSRLPETPIEALDDSNLEHFNQIATQ